MGPLSGGCTSPEHDPLECLNSQMLRLFKPSLSLTLSFRQMFFTVHLLVRRCFHENESAARQVLSEEEEQMSKSQWRPS